VWDTCLIDPARRRGMGTISDVGDGQGVVKMLLDCGWPRAVPSLLTLYVACTPCTAGTSHAAWVIEQQRDRPGWPAATLG
jgi:hypothetical protein